MCFRTPVLKGRPIRHWQVVVICPSRDLNVVDPTPVREFVERRVVWIELAPERLPPTAPPLQRAFGMLRLSDGISAPIVPAEPGGPLPAPGLRPAAWPGPAAPFVLQRISLPGDRPYAAVFTW
jgi:hypothetical protein